MKKLISVGVILVSLGITIIIIFGFYEDGKETLTEIYIANREEPDGEITCPNGFTIVPADFIFSLKFERENPNFTGKFSVTSLTPNSPEILASLSNGSFDSGSYLFTGESFYNSVLSILCSLDKTDPQTITVWGMCGNEVLINFETKNGISGIATGIVDCM